MAKKSSLFSGRKARKSSVDKFKESDLYKKIYGKTHEERVAEYKEWKQKEIAKGFNMFDDTKGKKGHQRIDLLIRTLDEDEQDEFRDLYDDSDPDSFFELGTRVAAGESVKSVAEWVDAKNKFNPDFEG